MDKKVESNVDNANSEEQQAVEQLVIKTVASSLNIEEDSISPRSKFVDDLGADSLDVVELMMAIEAAFDCDIPDEEAGKISTVADAVTYIHKLKMQSE